MKTKKILYLADGNSIHDIKWISFFADQKEKYSCFLLCDTLCILSDQTKAELKERNIHVLPQIAPFSIASPLKTWKSISQFKKIIREIQPELVHVLFAAPNALWLNFVKIPSIITMRGSDILIVIPDLLLQKGIKKMYFGILFRMFRKSFLNANVVTGTSWTQLIKAERLFKGSNLQLVRTGVDVLKISEIDQQELIPQSLTGKEFVFSPRFMSPIYNIEFQLEAISMLNPAIIERFTFVFIRGKHFDAEYYQRQILKLNDLERNIRLKYIILEYLDQPTMWMFLKNASLCLMTPTSDGTPNSALEAMSAKCPIIISNLDYDSDLFEGTCLKLKTFDSSELQSLIQFALEDYPVPLLEKAYEKVNGLGNRDIEMKKLEDFYQL